MRILLICDHKWRDLPNLIALKVRLEHRFEHTVVLTPVKDMGAMFHLFEPHCVVFNHMNLGPFRQFAKRLQEDGAAVVVLPTEGRPSRKELLPVTYGKYTDYSNVDLYLSWSAEVERNMVQLGTLLPDHIETVGCTRFDFYREPLCRMVSTRERFCAKHDLDPDRPIVTWATQYNYARFLHENQEFNRKDLTRLGVKACFEAVGYDIERLPEDQHYERLAAADAFFEVARARPQVQFIIKPHPGEDIAFYQERVKRASLPNVSFIFQEYIWDLLNATDLHLHQACTTAIEGWLLRKPTVEMKLDNRLPFVWDEMEAGSDKAESAADLGDIVDSYLTGHTLSEGMQSRREQHIEKWFYKVDGRRCQEAARHIDNLLEDHPGRRHWSWKVQLRYALVDRFDLPWSISLRKPSTWAPERPTDGLQLDFKGQVNKHITRFDVRSYQARIKPLILDRTNQEGVRV